MIEFVYIKQWMTNFSIWEFYPKPAYLLTQNNLATQQQQQIVTENPEFIEVFGKKWCLLKLSC